MLEQFSFFCIFQAAKQSMMVFFFLLSDVFLSSVQGKGSTMRGNLRL